MNTKSSTTTVSFDQVATALDQATTLHNTLTQLSQSVPPQVSLANVIIQSEELRNTLEELTGEKTTTTTKQTENV